MKSEVQWQGQKYLMEWLDDVNFEELGERYKTEPINLKSKAVAYKAKGLGYDGIKYGDKIIQGLG